MSSIGGPRIVKDGLVLYLDAGNLKSYTNLDTIWVDLSGNGNNSDLLNGPTFDNGNGGSILFDGLDDYVDASSYVNSSIWNTTYPNGLTIDVTFKIQEPFPSTNDGRTIITRNSGSSGTNAFNFSIQSNRKHRFWINTVPGVFSNTTFSTNTIYNTILTWDQMKVTYYVNGFLDSITSYSPSLSTKNQTYLTIGNWVPTQGWQFPGNIYSLKFYNRALTSSEIIKNYNSTKSRFFF